MPHSYSVPFDTFLKTQSSSKSDKTYTVFLSPDEIKEELQNRIGAENLQSVLDGKRSIVTTCGSGMTAGILWLGLRLIGVEKPALYDEVITFRTA